MPVEIPLGIPVAHESVFSRDHAFCLPSAQHYALLQCPQGLCLAGTSQSSSLSGSPVVLLYLLLGALAH